MVISELIDDRDVSTKLIALLSNWRLNKEIETPISDSPRRNCVLGTVQSAVRGAHNRMADRLGLSEFGTHDKNVVLRNICDIQVADDLHRGRIPHSTHVPPKRVLS